MKKMISVVLIFALLCTAFSVTAFAAREMGDNDVDAGDWEVDGTTPDPGPGPGEEPTPGEGLLGDANGDGQVNGLDAISIQLHVLGKGIMAKENLADFNKDGEINGLDAIAVQLHVLGKA